VRAAVLLLALTGCASTMPETVMVPVPVPCLSEMPAAPVFATDAELVKLADTDFILALGVDRLERRKYIGVLEAVLQGCVK